MNPNYYCDTVQSELTARAFDIIRNLENAPNKDQLAGQFKEVYALVDDLNVTIGRLRTECPTEFSSHRSDIEKKKTQLLAKMNKWDEEHIAGEYVGG